MSYSFNGRQFESLTEYIQALKDSDNRYNSYEPWSSQEDQELLVLSESMTVAELADHFKRRKGGIASRLKKYDDYDIKKSDRSLNTPIFKKNIFEQIIKDLRFSFKINNDDNLIKFTKSLTKPLSEFHFNINKRGIVRMDYANKTNQIIYVLRYFHAYWYQINYALNIIKEDLFLDSNPQRELRIALFAAGPAPELIGITRFLEANPNKFPSVSIDLFDQEGEWEFARQTFLFSNGKKNLLENNLNIKIKTYSIRLDNLIDLKNFKVKNYYDVVSFQNCLNEFWDNLGTSGDKFFSILDAIKPSGFAIFTDRDTRNTVKPFNEIKQLAYHKQYEISLDIDYEKFDALNDSPLPEILSNGNFYAKPFSESGISAMRTNRFKYLIIKKPIPKNFSTSLVDTNYLSEDHDRIHSITFDSNRNDLIGKSIIHKDFGEGIINDCDNHSALIEFNDLGMVFLKLPVTRMRFK